ncbi:MAG: hypothetical protein R3B53_03415 [Candidatus Paceibacterota bacterium]
MLNLIEQKVERGFDVEICDWEGFVLHMIRSLQRPDHDPHLPASVHQDGKLLWSYTRDHKGFRGLAQLFEHKGEYVIGLCCWHELYDVIPVRDLPKMVKIGGVFLGGRELDDIIQLKLELAKEHGLQPIWSDLQCQRVSQIREEQKLVTTPAKAKSNTSDTSKAKKLSARVAREARQAKILKRSRQYVFTKNGESRNGVPVVGDEWMCLMDGTYCVSVSSYDDETGEVGEVQECFIVVKKGGGNPKQAHPSRVFKENLTLVNKINKGNDDLSVKLIKVAGKVQPVVMAGSMDGIRTLRDQGLNGGTLAMCPKAGDEGRFAVFKLTSGKIEPVTEVMRKQ